MKLNKTISLTALTAIAAVAAVFSLREPTEPAMNAGPVSNPETAATETDRTSYPVSQNTLTEQEQAQFVELQQEYSMEELKRVFNPQTSEEREQARLRTTLTPFDHANFAYDSEWAGFVDSLGLSPEDTRLVRDIWTDSKARFIELGAAMGDGSLESGTAGEAQREVENRLYSRLSEVLSPEQMQAYFDHDEKNMMDARALSQTQTEELLDTGYSGIVVAAGNNDLRSVQAYLASGADPNRLTTDGRSAIHEAATDNNLEILRALIDAGANVNLTMPGERSALMYAAMSGSTDAAQVLVEAGADPNYARSDNPFSSALNSAARNGHTEIVRILLEAGADVTGPAGGEALINAIEFANDEMEQMLIEANADADAPRVAERRSFFDLGRRLGLVDD